jgi:hypothetical protein
MLPPAIVKQPGGDRATNRAETKKRNPHIPIVPCAVHWLCDAYAPGCRPVKDRLVTNVTSAEPAPSRHGPPVRRRHAVAEARE